MFSWRTFWLAIKSWCTHLLPMIAAPGRGRSSQGCEMGMEIAYLHAGGWSISWILTEPCQGDIHHPGFGIFCVHCWFHDVSELWKAVLTPVCPAIRVCDYIFISHARVFSCFYTTFATLQDARHLQEISPQPGSTDTDAGRQHKFADSSDTKCTYR